ncbi:MAG TPA: divalent metal cation transporter, partial [Candidatus Saccharimonadales bacterium]|nr:divalent metal cation transporter [Candidatus Saccharimonadales bacterium]
AHFPRWVLYFCTILLFVANVINISADLGAMAQATKLVLPGLNFTILVLGFTIFSLILQIFISYEKFASFLKWLALILIAYVVTAFLVNVNWGEVAINTVVPRISLNKEMIILIAAVLGTTISPYLFFWQTSQEVEEEILEGKVTLTERKDSTTDESIKKMRVDVWSGMFLSNIVMFFIIATCAATLHQNGVTSINDAAQAAAALEPLAGKYAYLLFTLGIIGTGLLAVPVLAGSASYAISESFGWKQGLYRKLRQAYSFYGVIIIALLIGLAINFIGIDPIKALIFSAVVNAIVAPVVLVLIVILSSREKIMGERKNGWLTKITGSAITLIMIVTAVVTLVALAV